MRPAINNRYQAKRAIARASDLLRLTTLGHRLQLMRGRVFIRAVNYHDVPPALAAGFENQLRHFAGHFSAVGYQDVRELILTGRWRKPKPGLLLSFDDGLRSHAEVVAPLLERYGFVGWFFLPAQLLDVPPLHQRAAAHESRVMVHPSNHDPRVFMRWADARHLAEQHVVGSHTLTHTRLQAGLPPERLHAEVAGSRELLTTRLEAPVSTFCWVGGEERNYSSDAAIMIKGSGYQLSFMTNSSLIRPGTNPLQLQRTNVEADDPLWLVRFQLSGLMDLAYTRKRRRVNRLTGAA